ncbi:MULTISPECIES: PspC domain-containing protein [unclassified Flavobacterium]|uniref:PspC domain-containing protein n=1 Tax=unclassified Flavobacterium TaxID=196869 RepID=UPI001F135238|nr:MULTISPECIES: PspC domain-containing protein [unclassified Flavobacterium]UMY65667.1 PspC domain-containing protein [Flavobacterium sp. HJ-32-4]
MNKTVNINLGGIFFYIDEDAYQRLSRYFDAIKRSLNRSAGQDEIIRDIEMRIAELISEKHTHPKQVISMKEIEEVIAVMGQPEDYRLDDEGAAPQPNTPFYSPRATRKLYRDRENGIIGGVLAGLGHYFGIDKVWLRVLFVILLCVFGTGIIAYLVMWIVMPEAVTTTEKLEMRGEPITISNIERKVREEIEGLSERFRNADYAQMGDSIHKGATKVGSTIGDIFISIFKVFAKIIGSLIILASLAVIVSLLIGVFTLGSTAFVSFPWSSFVEQGNFGEYPIWLFGLVMFFAVGIPFFYFCLLGFKLLAPKIKSPGAIINFGLLAVWIISTAIAITFGVRQATAFAFEGKTLKKEELVLAPADTLDIKFVHNDSYANSTNEYDDFRIELDGSDHEMIYSNDVTLDVRPSDDDKAYIQVQRIARGSSVSDARRTAEKIVYGYKFQNNDVLLDNYLLTDIRNKFRDQQVEVVLYLPKGTKFRVDKSVTDRDRSDDAFFNLHWSDDSYTYRVDKDRVRCLDCPPSEDEYNDIDDPESVEVSDSTGTMTVKVHTDGDIRVETTTQSSGKGLTTDQDGKIVPKK